MPSSGFRIRDPIYNLVRISADEKFLWELLNSPELQRLRHIKQLGFSDFVYPGASHTRFSHSVGTLEMARKMITALEDNTDIVESRGERYPHLHDATLCAALLHDVGHGPFSHVFEEIRHNYGYHRPHEDFTVAVINSPRISKILGPKITEEVTRLISSEDAGVFKNIVSHQIDADRLDFIQRDKHFTGIQFGSFDIEWMLDSLRVGEVVYGTEEADTREQFVFDYKGLMAVEEFVASYVKIYRDVYFHKTTRAVQWLFLKIVKHLVERREQIKSSGIESPVFDYFDLIEKIVEQVDDHSTTDIRENELELEALNLYMAMTDATVVDLISRCSISSNVEKVTKDLCVRFTERDLFKCLELGVTSELEVARIRDLKIELRKRDLPFYEDTIKAKGMKAYTETNENYLKNILFDVPGETSYKPLYKLSKSAEALVGNGVIRFYFENQEDKKTAKAIWLGEATQ